MPSKRALQVFPSWKASNFGRARVGPNWRSCHTNRHGQINRLQAYFEHKRESTCFRSGVSMWHVNVLPGMQREIYNQTTQNKPNKVAHSSVWMKTVHPITTEKRGRSLPATHTRAKVPACSVCTAVWHPLTLLELKPQAPSPPIAAHHQQGCTALDPVIPAPTPHPWLHTEPTAHPAITKQQCHLNN